MCVTLVLTSRNTLKLTISHWLQTSTNLNALNWGTDYVSDSHLCTTCEILNPFHLSCPVLNYRISQMIWMSCKSQNWLKTSLTCWRPASSYDNGRPSWDLSISKEKVEVQGFRQKQQNLLKKEKSWFGGRHTNLAPFARWKVMLGSVLMLMVLCMSWNKNMWLTNGGYSWTQAKPPLKQSVYIMAIGSLLSL